MIRQLMRREIQLVLHNRNIIAVIFLAPLFFSFFYATIYLRKSEHDVGIVVVDTDRSGFSRMLIRDLNSNRMIRVLDVVANLTDARNRLEYADAQAVVYIPADFQRQLFRQEAADLVVYLNASRFLVANDINRGISEVVGTIGAGITIRYYQSEGLSFEQGRELAVPLSADLRSMFNPTESYGDFILPAVLALILQTTLLMGLAQSVAGERGNGTLGELQRAAQGSVWNVVVGKGAPYAVLFGAYAFFFYIVPYSLFKLPFLGSAIAMSLVTLFFLLSIITLCIFLASFFKSGLVALQMSVISTYPAFLLSGYSWPLFSMPLLPKAVAMFIPSTPYLTAVARITQMGGNFSHVWPQFLHLLLLTAAGLIAVHFRWRYLFQKAAQGAGDIPGPARLSDQT